MKNRATTDKQKREVIERLYAAWTRLPKLRFSQMLIKAMDRNDYFYTEDFDLVAAVEAFVTKAKQK